MPRRTPAPSWHTLARLERRGARAMARRYRAEHRATLAMDAARSWTPTPSPRYRLPRRHRVAITAGAYAVGAALALTAGQAARAGWDALPVWHEAPPAPPALACPGAMLTDPATGRSWCVPWDAVDPDYTPPAHTPAHPTPTAPGGLAT